MAKVDVRFRQGAFYDLRSLPGPVGKLNTAAQRAAAVASSMGGQYSVGSRQGAKRPQGRWRTSVAVGDIKARVANAKHHSLVKGLGSVAGST